MRIITGTIRSTPLHWLPVLSNIVPPHIRRQIAVTKSWEKFHSYPNDFPIISYIPDSRIARLKSRKPLWINDFLYNNRSDKEVWRSEWNSCNIFKKGLITDPSEKVPGFNLPRKIWCTLNRLRTGHGRCNSFLFKWNSIESPSCECGEEEETIEHLVTSCSIYKFEYGFEAIHSVSDSFLRWIVDFKQI